MRTMADTDDRAESAIDPRHRRIRSFVLRQGRFTPAQQRAFIEHWARFGIEPDITPDWNEIFGRVAPRVLEIGFGNGEQLLWSAQNEPERNFIGIEVHRPGVGRLMNALAAHNVHNVRLYNHDAVDILERAFGAGSLEEVRIYFPDPWPKKRQQKRRLIQPEFIGLLASRVKAGGKLCLATDWQEYADHMLTTIDAAGGWRNTSGRGHFSARPQNRIETHFEKRGARLGHASWDLVYERT
ncbi:MAG TPA: tRNA (guanosine(46)-N7)-methyltransferase TrmB [Rudaea sp.]|nr:tRNA (guanosine(46)-N7)-methyltransferase TrmB [Rudaea sp.]